MADERNKSVDSEGTVTGEYDSVKKKKRENKSAEDGEKLGEDIVVKKKSKKTKKREKDSVEDGEKLEEETVVKKKSKKRENKSVDDGEKLGEEIVVEKKKEIGSEIENDAKKLKKKKKKRENESAEEGGKLDEDIVVEKKSKKLEKKFAEDGEKLEEDIVVEKKSKKQEKESTEDGEKMDEEIIVKKKSKKRESKSAEDGEKTGEDIEAKMKKDVDSEVEDDGKESKKKKKKSKKKAGGAESEDNQGDETPLVDADGANKKTSKRKRDDSDSGAEENTEKKKKKKKKPVVEDTEVGEKNKEKKRKKVKFSDQQPEVFLIENQDREEEEESDEEKSELVRGKRYSKEEDEIIKNAVLEYIDNHALGDEGVNMVMECKLHPQLRGCWKEIASAIPWRPHNSVYDRAHTLFEAKSRGEWSQEDLELVRQFHKKHGSDWKTLADAMGKSRKHVKDAWRRIRLAAKKRGHWSREEYQALFDLVNKEIKMKAFKEKHSKHGMLRDDIPWTPISDELGSRDHVTCCLKWYSQLTSPMVEQEIWDNVDDYRLVEELVKLDAACIDDVDWDNLLENRDGEVCRKRWKQMVLHIGSPASKTFAEQVEILSERYCPDLAEDREDFDNRPFDD